MFRKLIIFLFLVLTAVGASSAQRSKAARPYPLSWHSDILGDGYELRYVDQGTDYAGPVRSTIVRKLSVDTASVVSKRAILYVHGYNDYFFNRELGNECVSHGYNFYAVDLRRYGRSLMEGQHRFEARSMREYFPDIDSAMVEISRQGVSEIVLMGHSTGGLITSYYLHCNPQAPVKALVLNSPFLDWNQGWLERFIPIVSWLGLLDPDMTIRQGASTAYSESLLAGEHGRWHYNTQWKMPVSPDVTAGWVRAITLAQWAVRLPPRIRVPILLMYSARSVEGGEWTPEHNEADGVLDVHDIARFGGYLGTDVTKVKVEGGLHDLVLSRPGVARGVYRKIFSWLDKKL